MKWMEKFKAPLVTVEGNRFTVTPAFDDREIIDGEIVDEMPQTKALAVRQADRPQKQPAPKVGQIPRHSWGA
jgi:hypothetical protein